MGLKATLTLEANTILDKNRNGSFSTRLRRKRYIEQIINDLLVKKIAPNSLKNLQKFHIDHLVHYWKKHGNKDSSIAVKLSSLKFLSKKLGVNTFKVQDFNLKSKNSNEAQQWLNLDDILIKPFHVVTKSVLNFQVFFGLTKFEAIRINQMLIPETDKIYVTSKISYNNACRMISLTNSKQKQLIADRINLLANDFWKNELDIVNLYNSELKFLNIPISYQFRNYYILERYKALANCFIKTKVINTLIAETGINYGNLIKILEL